MKKVYKVTYTDLIEAEDEAAAYASLLNYLGSVVEYADVEAFDFEDQPSQPYDTYKRQSSPRVGTPPRTIEGNFPYEEIRRPDGDYFQSWKEAKDAGWDDDQIWSVTSAEGDDGSEWTITGPPHHYVNHIGHVATLERHDNNTYYEECWRTAEEAAEDDEEPVAPPKTDERELENISLRVMLATALDALVEHGDETTEPWLREQLLKLK